MKPIVFQILLFCIYFACKAQVIQSVVSSPITTSLEAKLYNLSSSIHTSIQPFSPFEIYHNTTTIQHLQDSLIQDLQLNRPFFTDKWLGRKLVNEPFIQVGDEQFTILVNPIVGLLYGEDSEWTDRYAYQNTRGIQLVGKIGQKLTFYSDFQENQVRFARYVHDYTEANRIIPGQGAWKRFKDLGAKDFAWANGHVSFQPNKIFNFQFGHGKHFIGDGYRSLLLSDNSFNYPYFRITAQFWRIKYWVLYKKLLDINDRYANGTFLRKYVSSHYLSFRLSKRWNIGLFETIIYGDPDGTRGLEWDYLNPIIFFRPVEFSLGSRGGNALLGLNLSFKVTDKVSLYGQFILDEFKLSEIRAQSGWWANKYGIQIGFKSFDTFIDGLFVQSELNTVRPYTYSHLDVLQNYAHYNQTLAHPLGANFIESVSHIRYTKGRWFLETEFMYTVQGRDTATSNWGTNVYLDYNTREQDYENETLQGVQTTTFFWDTKLGWMVNPSYNLRFEVGYTNRKFTPEIEEIGNLEASSTSYWYIGLTTRLYNTYYDF